MGDFGGRLSFPRMMVNTLKTKLGVYPDLRRMRESTANTSLEYHAGDAAAMSMILSLLLLLLLLLLLWWWWW